MAASKPFQLVDCPISPRHICRMAIIGYARVSTVGQNLDVQIQQLTEHGCDRIFQEKVSGTKIDRPQLKRLLSSLQPRDTLVVARLDRLARSCLDLLNIAEGHDSEGSEFSIVSGTMGQHIDSDWQVNANGAFRGRGI
jgi:DNA invertase Pin-like site-specific DNA recombinase